MNLYRLQIRVLSPWRTPWQADTLCGALLGVCARIHGPEFLAERLIRPMLEGKPPFTLSDAFPRGYLPAPMSLRLPRAGKSVSDFKMIKKLKYLAREDFLAARRSDTFIPGKNLKQPGLFEEFRHHNTLRRDNNTSLKGGLFNLDETYLKGNNPGLDLYLRAADADALELCLGLLSELSLTGFGADASAGRGQFELEGEPAPEPELETVPQNADAVIVLSTFQPAKDDSRNGLWEAFPKFGKLGPGLGVADVRKNTLILWRAGACLRAVPQTHFLGRAVPMDELLPQNTADDLRKRNINIVHPAFGLAVPALLADGLSQSNSNDA